ncbi:hypothetical protein P3339_12330 [Microbulbifer sp. MLAF003]|uniref:DUF6702 family protein n=1 Tax=unclassified Microbulbifer TaxID=2619833 RepID=UPI0024ACB09D|nr:DUF6702 family protein [Microbulbifer sp. MLAF003]WHI49274.1 hypothetical protein P3339_12330 [Microbulbifer sp. MLAF003]
MKVLFSFLLVVTTSVIALQANAHRYHFGLTSLSVNERTQTLEISHRFFVADIEKALSISAGKELNEAQQQMENYVNSRFQVSQKNGDVLNLNWVGMEADVHDIWIYQEVPLVDLSSKKLSIKQSMLMEIERDQVNTITVNNSSGNQSYTLKSGESRVEFSL